MERFEPANLQHRLHDQLRELKQDTTVREYIGRFQDLLSQVDSMTEVGKVAYFVAGLKPDLRCELRRAETVDTSPKPSVSQKTPTMRCLPTGCQEPVRDILPVSRRLRRSGPLRWRLTAWRDVAATLTSDRQSSVTTAKVSATSLVIARSRASTTVVVDALHLDRVDRASTPWKRSRETGSASR